MAELGDNTKKNLLSGKVAPQNVNTMRYVDNDDARVNSSKERYFRWLSRLVMLCAIISLSFFLCASLVIFRLSPEIMVEPLLITM